MKTSELPIRPYARLLTMLSEQLIKNERIALLELIKNSYDADANLVRVTFDAFNDDMTARSDSRIIIEDDGHGMSPEVIRESWMNPANPQKYIRKKKGNRRTLGGKRIVQGEKGIGRFALLKLGSHITVTTRTECSSFESVLVHDFTKYDSEFTEDQIENRDIYLDEIRVLYSEISPPKTITQQHGTKIVISKVKGVWSKQVVSRLIKDLSALTDPISKIAKHETATDSFLVTVECNGSPWQIEDKNEEILKRLIEDKSVLRIQGKFDSEIGSFFLSVNEDENKYTEIKLDDSLIIGLLKNNQYLDREIIIARELECGSFEFHFYVFDFSRGISGKHELNTSEKRVLKDYRIYLYRDGVRVYPYGDPEDDWLNIDVARGTGRAGNFFSNDQLVGWIDITQEHNPKLRDKTNREGLIEEGNAVSEFFGLIQTILSYIKSHHYAQYQAKNRDRNAVDIVRSEVVSGNLATLRTDLERQGLSSGGREVARIEKLYKREKDHLIQRAEMVEDLAGVGLSVEMASHDIMLLMTRAMDIGKELSRLSRKLENDTILRLSDMLVGVLSQIADGINDIQSLFKSAKRRRKALRIEPILDKMYQLYQGLLEKRGIRYEKTVVPGSPLVADTNEGVAMQVLINLFDNASYWLDTVDNNDKKINVTVDGTNGDLVFSDNGPGIDEDDLPYIFEPFYSGKGQEGRGLGLYIARQLLERHDYQISVAKKNQSKSPGANFVVSFVKEAK
ncbi:MAG: ATP-binding protein [Gemmatimonadetes bacterium]|nr:ATP-binding protein [Gemmatimonadota bacterium]MYB60220.1 ATP-binding protein [Gemmatimonadota bacterium]